MVTYRFFAGRFCLANVITGKGWLVRRAKGLRIGVMNSGGSESTRKSRVRLAATFFRRKAIFSHATTIYQETTSYQDPVGQAKMKASSVRAEDYQRKTDHIRVTLHTIFWDLPNKPSFPLPLRPFHLRDDQHWSFTWCCWDKVLYVCVHVWVCLFF